MQNKLCETVENIEFLASFDFLDVCLLGETGTGKTHTARLIHELSPRAEKPFIAVNCAELSPTLIEAELFGYEKGAFTGANFTKTGKFEAAAGGTIFLDEIGELPTGLQAKLLKVVEEKCVTRVGGNRLRPVNVRIIYATHRDLASIREDLRYRINAHAIHLKPLRERREEIVSLARLFLLEFSKKSRRTIYAEDKTLKILETAEWRGNVRELRSFVEKICLMAIFAAGGEDSTSEVVKLTDDLLRKQLSFVISGRLDEGHIVLERFPNYKQGEKMEDYLEKIEIRLLKTALEAHDNNHTRAAKELGISRTGLIKKLKRIGH